MKFESNVGGNQIVNGFFSHSILWNIMWIWSTNVQLQRIWKSWLANLRNFCATDTSYACFHRSTAFTFASGFVTYILPSTLFVAALLLFARSRIEFLLYPTGTFDFVDSREYGYKSNFLNSFILSVSDSVPDEDTFRQIRWSKNEFDGVAYSTALKRERNLSLLHDVMKFCNLTIRKIRFIMPDSRKYREKLWNVLDTFCKYWWAV